ncbi:hypothetical protein ColTof4_10897 [Colletotrichum tofieldiae]|nr:hypothetical protein ColTof4_10897 [Colletotrichum tofieldiae]GKT85838.1 hypothetical protein Ct61P_03688 [Colletotrichum tofieldiae]
MVPNILPNWARFIKTFSYLIASMTLNVGRTLSILTVTSYLPQYHRLREQGHCDGLSLFYVLFNLISATEQFTIGLFLNVNDNGFPRPDVFVNNPATVGDWLNFGQLALVWLCSLLMWVTQ